MAEPAMGVGALRAFAVVALFGCSGSQPPLESVDEPASAPTPEEQLGQSCFEGETPSCIDAIVRAANPGEFEVPLELSLRACAAGGLETCYWAAIYDRKLGRLDESRARIVETCARGHEPSCLVARHDEIQRALDQHLELWQCAKLLERVHSKDVWIEFELVDNTGDGRADVELAAMPEHPILQACVADALASTSFPFAEHERTSYILRFDPEVVAAKLAELARAGTDEPIEAGPSACPDVPERCEPVALPKLMREALWVPEPSLADLLVELPTGPPTGFRVEVEFCVDPRMGKVTRVRTSQPWLGHPVLTRLAETVARWRFRPILVDGEPVLACSRIDVEFAVPRDGPEEPPWPAKPRLLVHSAKAVYAPPPSRAQLHATHIVRWRGRNNENLPLRGANVTAYCIDERGRTTSIETHQRFRQSGEVDQLLRATVARWRFKPMIIDGAPHISCTEQRFVIEIE